MKKLFTIVLVLCFSFLANAQVRKTASDGEVRIVRISENGQDHFSKKFKSKKFKKQLKGHKKQFKSLKKGFVGRKAKFRKIGRKTSRRIRSVVRN